MPTKIEYVDESINPIRTKGGGWHCIKTSPGCKNCYAEKINLRFGDKLSYLKLPDRKVELILNQKALEKPLKWKKPKRIFVQDMSDILLAPAWMIDRILEVVGACPQHTFHLLTKRPELYDNKLYGQDDNSDYLFRTLGGGDYYPNLWLGCSVENQKIADERIPHLLQMGHLYKLWVSVEPMLGPVDLRRWLHSYTRDSSQGWPCAWGDSINRKKPFWVVCGGESGPGARPMSLEWVHQLRDQCLKVGTPFFFKGWGEWGPIPDPDFKCSKTGNLIAFDIRQEIVTNKTCWKHYLGCPKCREKKDSNVPYMYRVGKKAAGRELDGQIWSQLPEGNND